MTEVEKITHAWSDSSPALEERAAVVAWLRETERSLGHVEGGTLWDAANAIERGDHLAAAHEEPPVDPDLLIAREAAARHYRAKGFPKYAVEAYAGRSDEGNSVQLALAAIKLAREQGAL